MAVCLLCVSGVNNFWGNTLLKASLPGRFQLDLGNKIIG